MQAVILVITYYFPPSGGAGVQRWLKFCKYLPSFGVQPIVLTVDPNNASYPQVDNSLLKDVPANLQVVRTKTKEILQLYKKVSPTKELPHTGFANQSKPSFMQQCMKFIRGNFFIPDPRKGWCRYAYSEACRLIRDEHIDTIITTSPPHSAQLIGLRLKKRFPTLRWIADLRDPWTDLYTNKDLYQTYLARKYNAYLERKVLETADEVITVSPSCANTFASKVKRNPIHVITNGFDENDFKDIVTQPHAKRTIAYVGALSPLYEFDTFVEAIRLLPKQAKDQLKIQMVGGAFANAVNQLQSLGVETEWIDYVQHKEAVTYMLNADMLLLLFPNQEDNKGILTGKLFEYMATHNPILMIGFTDGDAAKLLRQYEQDGVYAFGEADKVAQFIIRSIDKYPAVHADFAQQFSRKKLTEVLSTIILPVV